MSLGVPIIEIGSVDAALGVLTILIGIGISWGSLRTAVKNIENTLEKNILPELKDVRERINRFKI